MRVYRKEDITDAVSGVGGGGNREVTLTSVGATLNQYAGKYMVVIRGDQAGTSSIIASNTAATPTVLTVSDDQNANLDDDDISIQTSASTAWVRVSGIVKFPNTATRLDVYGLCVVTLSDYEGALYDDWYNRDFTEMKVTDDAGTPNVIFRGYLKNKRFHAKDLVLEIVGIGEMLERKSFGHEELINYILAEGKVDTTNASSVIDLYHDNNDDFVVDAPEEEFSWDVGYWASDGKDVALLIVDNTASHDSRTWDSSAIALVGDDDTGGNNASTLTYGDSDILWATDTTDTDCDLVINSTIDGAVIDNANSLKSIEIQYSFRLKVVGFASTAYGKVILEILKDTKWKPLDEIYIQVNPHQSTTSAWTRAIPAGEVGSTKAPYVITEGGDDTELQKYFTVDGADDYDALKGLRFKLEGTLSDSASATVYVDYIKVIIKYNTFDVSPIVNRITDNTATTITCADVSDFQELGITDSNGTIGDAFQIGQNTRHIVDDIASESGLDIVIIDGMDNEETMDTNYPTGDGGTIDWDTTGGDHFGELDDPGHDETYVSTNANQEEEIYTLTDSIINLYDGYVNKIEIKARCKVSIQEGQILYFRYSVDGGATWSDPQDTSTNITAAWGWHTLTFSSLEEYDMSDLQIKMYNGFFVMGGTVYVSEIYVKLTLSMPNWNKYMARKFKGKHCLDALRAVLILEAAHWMEDYENNRILLIKKTDFVDSGVDLTEANYDHDWEIEDKCNQVRAVYVWGKTSFNKDEQVTVNIFAKAEDTDIKGGRTVQIRDDSISNQPEAQEIADAQLLLLKTKRPSIRIPMKGINSDLVMGTTVGLTMARPTVADTDYVMRMIERIQFGITEIYTIIHCGMGETKWDEKFFKTVRHLQSEVHRLSTEGLTSTPYETGSGGITWGAIIGGAAGAAAAVLADDKYLKNDANDETTGDLTVANLITAGLVDGKDVSGLCTTAEAHAYVEANALALTANLTTNGLIDGQDIAAMATDLALQCTTAEAHAYVEANALTMTQDITFNAGQTFDGEDVSALAADLANQATEAEALAHVEATGITLAASKTINIDGTPADATYTGIVLDIDTTGCATYDAVYIDGVNSCLPALATGLGTMPAIGICVAAGKVLVLGAVRIDATFVLGADKVVYVSEDAAGDIKDAVPGDVGDIAQTIGYTVGTDMLYVNPAVWWVVRQ